MELLTFEQVIEAIEALQSARHDADAAIYLCLHACRTCGTCDDKPFFCLRCFTQSDDRL
jgi:hypothetical protein